MNLAPVGVSTYTRLAHLKKTIAALAANNFARETLLYVFSDAPRPGDEEKVAAVRAYLRTVDGFAEVNIVSRSKNGRVENSRGGFAMLIEKYGRAIFLEDDIETAPGFLTYMNQALDKYQDNSMVFSVTGYSPPIEIPEDFKDDVFFVRRFNGWGCGIWKDRFESIRRLTEKEFFDFYADRASYLDLIRNAGSDLPPMLWADSSGKIDALDVRAMYLQNITKQLTVYPSRSLVRNNGIDGSGIHCMESDRFDVELSQAKEFILPDDPKIDPRILGSFSKFRRGTFGGKLRVFMQSMRYRLRANMARTGGLF